MHGQDQNNGSYELIFVTVCGSPRVTHFPSGVVSDLKSFEFLGRGVFIGTLQILRALGGAISISQEYQQSHGVNTKKLSSHVV